jgi:3-phosphoshikimate 1-carboxyvinyltransferase
MAHAAAVLGLAVDGVEIENIATTAKTMPEFPDLWSALVG